MLKEITVFALLYAFVLSIEWAHRAYKRRQDRLRAMREEEDALDPISPLPQEVGFDAGVLRVIVLCCGFAVSHPTVIEAGKHYIVHFLIYSGYVIRGH